MSNAVNHGILTPLGTQQALEEGKSILFLLEANPGPGFGILLAYSIFGTGLLYQLATTMTANAAYRAAVGLALAATFLLIWINGAVGIIGDSDVNMLYVGVPMVGIAGALIAGFRAPGMARALFAAAVVQALVPVVALIIGEPDFAPGVLPVFGLNGGFVVLFMGSALLFRHAARQTNGPDGEPHLGSK